MIQNHAPARPVHILAHSLGVEVALEALHHLSPGQIDRIISMTGAVYGARAHAALATPAGAQTEFINITSRENDLFDFLFERVMTPSVSGDRSIGHGIRTANALTLQLDCPDTLRHLTRLGCPVALPDRRICHWSTYQRAGALPLYRALLRDREQFSFDLLRRGIPHQSAPRWSRLCAQPRLRLPLPRVEKPS